MLHAECSTAASDPLLYLSKLFAWLACRCTTWWDITHCQLLLLCRAGWTAFAGITSLALLLLAVATWAVRQYSSPSRDGYSVVKGAATS